MKSRFDAPFRLLGSLVASLTPALLAASGAGGGGLAAHDAGIVRTVGAGFAGAFRTLDLLVAAPFMLVPLGTRLVRAELASAVVAGIAGVVAFELARGLVRDAVPRVLERAGLRGESAPPRLLSVVAAALALTAVLSPAWQVEASAPGGAVTGALLVLWALRLAAAPSSAPSRALVLGLSLSYEPLVFASALAALAPSLIASRAARRPGRYLQTAAAFALGLVPLALGGALALRPPEIAIAGPALSFVDRAAAPVSVAAFVSADVGVFLAVSSVVGGALAVAFPASRRAALSLSLVVAIGALATALGMAAGPTRFGAPLLAAIVAAYALSAVSLGALVLAIARSRVPFAEASAALVVVLQLVLPVRAIDETLSRREALSPHAATIWNDVAWGDAPPRAVLLVRDAATMRRIASARARGEMRGDLLVVPAYAVQSRLGHDALRAEPKLAPLYRDMALGVPPEELSFAELAAERPLLATFEPTYSRTLARHFVPVGLTSSFEPEPRGASERRSALDAFAPAKDRLVRAAVAGRDPELARATARLLRARAIGMAAAGERDNLSRALDDLRAFAPDDPVGAALVRRIVSTRGPIDVRDLRP